MTLVRLGLVHALRLTPAVHPVSDRVPEIAQQAALLERHRARLAIDHAQRADVVTLDADRRAGVEADLRLVDDQRVVGEAGVARCVGNLEERVVEDRVRAERDVARGLACVGARPGEEPLPIAIDEADERDRTTGNGGGAAHETVQHRVRRLIEDV